MSNNFLIYILILLLFISCSDNLKDTPIVPSEEWFETEFSIALGNQANTTTRNLSETEEDYIHPDQIDILVFNASDNFLYRAKGYDWKYTPTTQTKLGTFKAYLPAGNNYNFAIYTNASSAVSTATINLGDSRSSVIDQITINQSSKWTADNSTLFTPFPMYGFVTSQNVVATDNMIPNPTSSQKIYMVRMHARIDVTNVASNFSLTETYLFKPMNVGFVSYKDANWNASQLKVNNADVPSSAVQVTIPFVYTAPAIHSIYTFESYGVVDPTTATAIVVGGNYDGSSTTTYYRIDIPATTTNYYNGDIVRNHLYNIKIKTVSDNGAADAQTAYEETNAKLEATVTDWSLISVSTILDDQYNIYVDKPQLIAPYGTPQVLTATTDHPDGIQVSPSSEVTVTGINSASSTQIQKLTVELKSGSTSANITLKAGNLRYVVKVKNT